MSSLDLFATEPQLRVRLDRDTDRASPCCDNEAFVGPAQAMHAGSLRCTRCGKHRGWVSAAALEAMHDDITKIFGRQIELPVLRTPPKPTGDDNMQNQFDNTNRGSIWKNTKKESATHPDFTGSINVEGKEFWVSAWRRKDDAPAKAPALTFSIKAKEEPAKKADPISTGRAKTEDLDIPF